MEWDYDPLIDFVNKNHVALGDSNDTPTTINHLQFSRNERFGILMTISSDANDIPKYKKMPTNQLHTPPNIDILNTGTYLGESHITGRLIGVKLQSVNINASPRNKDTATTSIYSISRIEWTRSPNRTYFSIDRIANLPPDYVWPHYYEEQEIGRYKRTFSGNPIITVDAHYPEDTLVSMSCARLTIGEYTVIIGTMRSKDIPTSKKPGYIYYSGCPDRWTREAIRDRLSFAFGIPLIYLGTCSYSDGSHYENFEAETPSTMSNRAWELTPQPFAPITKDGTNELDIDKLQQLAQSFFNNYQHHHLRTFLYRFWHAEISPFHMKPAYYGSMIENIQKREMQSSDSQPCRRIIPKANYKIIKSILTRLLSKQEIDANSKKLLLHKIDSGNIAPQAVIASRFYKTLDLNLGIIESKAWGKRNDAAHGNDIIPGGEHEHFRQTIALRIILVRIVLKLINGSDQYIDYYSDETPNRLLDQAIPEQVTV